MIQRNANPLDTIIDFALSAGADIFWINNAKDELKRLRDKVEVLNKSIEYPAAWARINDKGQLFDLRLQKNPHIDPDYIVPLYMKIDS